MKTLTAILNRLVAPPLTILSENTYLTAIRSAVVSLVLLTIIGGLFHIVCYFPLGGWEKLVEPHDWRSALRTK